MGDEVTSLADPSWGGVAPPDPSATLTAADRMRRMARLESQGLYALADRRPCYVCAELQAVYPCASCLRPVCDTCWYNDDLPSRCCTLEGAE